MARITIRSKIAQEANVAAHKDAALPPYPSTTWTGEAAWTDEPRKVEDRLTSLFRMFNRVTEEDCDRLDDLGYELPSLSVGDQIEMDGATYEVKPIGFERVA